LRNSAHSGFTLAEVLLAAGTIAVCILTVTLLLISLLRASRKSVDVSASELAADQIMNLLIYQAEYNDHANFWDNEYPAPGGPHYAQGTWRSNETDFLYEFDAETIPDATQAGNPPLGGSTALRNRLKQVTLRLTWWDGNTGQNRANYGKLRREVSRLIHEQPP
jgi:type II secretory pathway pseudopilin PulG